jgi:protein-disulfide isomerase
MNATHRTPTLAVPVGATDHVAGPEHAAVTVVEYGDFECPSCAAAEPAVRQLREQHAAAVRFVYRHFPLEDAHPHALMAAEAAEAAGGQGQFWPMHDLLLAHSRHLTRAHVDGHARSLDLDMARFKSELDDEIYRQRVREHQEGGRRSHLRATPTFFVNGVVQDVSGGFRALFDAVAAELRAVHPR